ncbi:MULTISPECIES: hypothetical protein [unclassified Isoptericola]|uniref:hypothetical protein n=1 Tax=unclassified Isoptericola TaxID=2623355 RepID=UPI00364D01A8
MPTPPSPLRPARRAVLGATLLVAVLAPAGCTALPSHAGGSLEVEVLSTWCDDGCTTAPAAGAEVEVLLGTDPVDRGTSDADGMTRFELDSVGTFEVVAHVGEVTSLPSQVDVQGGGGLTDVTIMVQAPGSP